MQPRRLSAQWVVPVDGPPLADGAVLIGADGRIDVVGPDEVVPRPPHVLTEDFGDALLLPGLINTHTHLELTGMTGAPGLEFAVWIRRLRAAKAGRTAEAFLEAARRGVADCWAAGITTVADTGDSGAVVQALAEAGGSAVVYQEVFGPHPDQCDESLRGLQRAVAAGSAFAGGRVRIGVSPHAPYTVSGRLYAATAAWARAESLPIAVHLAESPAESALLQAGAGPFAEAWHGRGIPLPSPTGATPVAWLDAHGVLGPRTLCIHLVQADANDIDLLATRGAAVAHCPRSNLAHGHGAAPLAELRRAGLRVGLGTDSVVSVETLDLLAEARAARDLAGLDPAAAVALCTLDGARALDLDQETGSLTCGKWADVVALRRPTAAGSSAPFDGSVEESVLACGPRDVLATFVGGRDVYRHLRSS